MKIKVSDGSWKNIHKLNYIDKQGNSITVYRGRMISEIDETNLKENKSETVGKSTNYIKFH